MRTLMEAVLWWIVLSAAYTLTLGAVTVPELAGAVLCAAVCAVPAVAARRALGGRWRPDPRWLRWAVRLAVAIPADTVRLHAHSSAARIRTVPQGRPDPSRAAFGTLVMSASPGSVVLDWPGDGSPVVLHEFAGPVHGYGHAAALFLNRRGYLTQALGATPGPRVIAQAAPSWTATGMLLGAISTLGALAVAAAQLRAGTTRGIPHALRRLHSGHVGDYVAWLFAGVAAFALLLVLR